MITPPTNISKQFDFLIIGGGIAGLSFASKVAPYGSVAVLFKRGAFDSSTSWAQGGIAAVGSPEDTAELHIEDTLRVGGGLCNSEIVKIVVNEGPERVRELEDIGVVFDREATDGSYHLHKEGGHSRRRVFHYHDTTGHEIQRALLKHVSELPSVTMLTGVMAIDLVTTRKVAGTASDLRVLGAYVLLPTGEVEFFASDRVLLATGGAGKVYIYTSNPDVATGDGIAMACRAGAKIGNMEFFQFHPTCLYHPKAKSFLLTEALRGEGALLTRIDGDRFMQRYDASLELAPRDVVARAIDFEMKATGDDHVLLDIRHRGAEFIKNHFPNIYQTTLAFGFDMTKEPIPVVPAAHFCCGGIITDAFGRTDIKGLYAAGECAHTGLHGANRLASNSLLEGVVFGHRAATDATRDLQDRWLDDFLPLIPPWDYGSARDTREQVVIAHDWDEIRRFMWNYVGIVRSNRRLERALRRSNLLEQEIREYYWNNRITMDLLELRNVSLVAKLTILSAMKRRESRGLHYNEDFPEANEKECHDTVVSIHDVIETSW